MRRILLILIVIILLAGIGLAAWWFLSVRSATPGTSGTIGTLPSTGGTVSGTNSTGTEEGQNGASPTLGTAQGALTQLTHNPILAYAPLANGTVRVLESTGQVSLITNNNEAVVESATSIDHPANVFLSHDGTKIVVSFGKPSARQTSVFNASTKKWSALPSGILSIVPSPTDARVAYTTES